MDGGESRVGRVWGEETETEEISLLPAQITSEFTMLVDPPLVRKWLGEEPAGLGPF